MKLLHRLIGAALVTGLAAPALATDNTSYPTRPITMVVPYTPGTGIDLIARTIGPKLTERLGQPVVVDNKPGASGNIGAASLANAAPDGYTLMVTVNTFAITPSFYKVPYDPVKDFQPIVQTAVASPALVINPSVLPAKNLEEFVAYVKANPGKLNYGSPGNGTPQHLSMELLKELLGLDVAHVPYKGSAGAVTDLMGGQIEMMVLPAHTALSIAQTGKVLILGVAGNERSVLAPDSPSFGELGIDGVDIDMYYWVAAPAGTPKDIVDRLNREITEIIALPDVRETLLKQGMVPTPSTTEAISTLIEQDVERWKKFVSEKGLSSN